MTDQVSKEFIETLDILNKPRLSDSTVYNLITDDRLTFFKNNILCNGKLDRYLKLCLCLIKFDNNDLFYLELNCNEDKYEILRTFNFRFKIFKERPTDSLKFIPTIDSLKYLIYDCKIFDNDKKLKLIEKEFSPDSKDLYNHITYFNKRVENYKKMEETYIELDDEYIKNILIDNVDKFIDLSSNFIYRKDFLDIPISFSQNLKKIYGDYVNKNRTNISNSNMSPMKIFENILNLPKEERLQCLDYENIIATDYLLQITYNDEINRIILDILLKKYKFEKLQKLNNDTKNIIAVSKENNCEDFFNKNKSNLGSFNQNCCVDINFIQCTKFSKNYDINGNYCICDDDDNKIDGEIDMKKKYLKYKMKYLMLKKNLN